MAASTSTPSLPLTFRQYTTLTRTDLPQGRIVEYTPSPRESLVESLPHIPKDSNSLSCNRSRPKSWATSTPAMVAAERKRRLEKMSWKGDNRRGSRASTTPKTSSSCKRSDSATNDSQRSALTSESIEERGATYSNELNYFGKSKDIDVPEEKNEQLTEDELDKRKNYEKCMNWIQRLPAKFSGMHIAQERAPKMKD